MKLNIIHISDIHLKKSRINEFKQKVYSDLLNTISKINYEKKIDFIFITGDLLDRGGAEFENIESAFDNFQEVFIKPLIDRLLINRERIIMVPGNHDIFEDDDCKNGFSSRSNDLKTVEELRKETTNKSIQPYPGLKRIIGYKLFEKEYFKSNNDTIVSLFQTTHIFDYPEGKVGITAFNTAWSCWSAQNFDIYFGENQIIEANDKLSDTIFKIALYHHSLDDISDMEKNEVISSMNRHYKLQYCGHQHKKKAIVHDDSYICVGHQLSIDAAVNDSQVYRNGFILTEIDTDLNIINETIYKYDNSLFVFEKCKSEEKRLNNIIDMSSKRLEFVKDDIISVVHEPINKNIGSVETDFVVPLIKYESNFRNWYDSVMNFSKYEKSIGSELNSTNIDFLDSQLWRRVYILEKVEPISMSYYDFLYEMVNHSIVDDFIEDYAQVVKYIETYWENFYEKYNIDIVNTKSNDSLFKAEIDKLRIDLREQNLFAIKGYRLERLLVFIIYMLIEPISHIQELLPNFFDDYTEEKKYRFPEAITDYGNNDNDNKNYIFIDKTKQIQEVIDGMSESGNSFIYAKSGKGLTYFLKEFHRRLLQCKIAPIIFVELSYEHTLADLMNLLLYRSNEYTLDFIDFSITINDLKDSINKTNIESISKQNLFSSLRILLEQYDQATIIIDAGRSSLITNNSLSNFLDRIDSRINVMTGVSSAEEIECFYEIESFNANDILNALKINFEISNKIVELTEGDFYILDDLIKSSNGNIDMNYIDDFWKKQILSGVKGTIPSIWLQSPILEETLMLQTIIQEPLNMRIVDLQMYLKSKGDYTRLPYIRQAFVKVDKQVGNHITDKISIIDRGIIKLLENDYYSLLDRRKAFVDIINWVDNDMEIDSSFLYKVAKAFINCNETVINNEIFYDFINKLGDKRAIDIAVNLMNDNSFDNSLAYELIKPYVEKKVPKAMSLYGYMLFFGDGIAENKGLAEEVLEIAKDNNDLNAMRLLADHYLDSGREELGLAILENLISQNDEISRYNYAVRFLFGQGVEMDSIKAIDILLSLSKNGFNLANRLLGVLYLEGFAIKRNEDEGVKYLKNLVEAGDDIAGLYLAKHYARTRRFDKSVLILEPMIAEGSEEAIVLYLKIAFYNYKKYDFNYEYYDMLELLVNKKNYKAMKLKADIIYENKDYMNQYEARLLYETLIGEGFTEEMVIYATHLFNKESPFFNIDEGERVLYKLSKLDNEAKAILGHKLLYGNDIEKNIDRGYIELQEAFKAGSLFAGYSIARSNIFKVNQNYNQSQGLDLLKKLCKVGYSRANILYSSLLNEGVKVPRNYQLALDLLKTEADKGNVVAYQRLGMFYVFGDRIIREVELGKNYFELAIKFGDTLSKVLYSEAIVKYIFSEDIQIAIEYLNEACEQNEEVGLRIYGLMLITGNRVQQDKKRGRELLKRSISLGDFEAKFQYASMLIEGDYFKKNELFGIKYLEELVENLYEPAIIELANRLISGSGCQKNEERGVELLVGLVAEKSQNGMLEYSRFLMFKYKSRFFNRESGEIILKESMDLGHIDSKFAYGKYIYEGVIGTVKTDGLKIIIECMNSGYMKATLYIANVFLRIRQSYKKDIDISFDPLDLYEQMVTERYFPGIEQYIEELLSGAYIEADKEKTIKLIDLCRVSGRRYGEYRYASGLIQGDLYTKNLDEGVYIMRSLVEEGYIEAIRYMVANCISGKYIPKDFVYVEKLCKEMVNEKDYWGTVMYSDLLFDGKDLKRNPEKAISLLRKLISEGHEEARFLLAKRHIDGEGLKRAVKKGRSLMDKCNDNHLPLEMIFEKGCRIKKEKRTQTQIESGNNLIEKAIKEADIEELFNLGMTAYVDINDLELAGDIFKLAYEEGNVDAGNSLAYMIRRGEYKKVDNEISCIDILEPAINFGRTDAYINKALCMVKGSKNDEDWEAASLLLEELRTFDAIKFGWWDDLYHDNDYEGLLIGLWLKILGINVIRNNEFEITKDIDFEDKNYYIPDWFEKVIIE